MVFSPVITCDRCEGCGFSHFLGPFFIQCRRCDGTGLRTKIIVRVWNAIRRGFSEDRP